MRSADDRRFCESFEFCFAYLDKDGLVQRVVDRQKAAVGSAGSVRVVKAPKPVRLEFVQNRLTSCAGGKQQEKSGEILHLSLRLYSNGAILISNSNT